MCVSRFWKLEVQELLRGCFLLSADKKFVHASHLISGGSLGTFGAPWLVGALPQPLLSSSHVFSVYVCVCFQISLKIYILINLFLAVLGHGCGMQVLQLHCRA